MPPRSASTSPPRSGRRWRTARSRRGAAEGIFVAEGCAPVLRRLPGHAGCGARGCTSPGGPAGSVTDCEVSDVDGIGVGVTERSLPEFDQLAVTGCTGVRACGSTLALIRSSGGCGCAAGDGAGIEVDGGARGTAGERRDRRRARDVVLSVDGGARPIGQRAARRDRGRGGQGHGRRTVAGGQRDQRVRAGRACARRCRRRPVGCSGAGSRQRGRGCPFAEGASGTVTESEFSGGAADGILLETEEAVTVSGCTVRDNHGSGVRQLRPSSAIEVIDLISSGQRAPRTRTAPRRRPTPAAQAAPTARGTPGTGLRPVGRSCRVWSAWPG